MERILDYVPRYDERSLKFGIMEATPDVREHSRTWTPPSPLNQVNQGACVGHGWIHEALTTPVRVDFSRVAEAPLDDPQAMAFWLYRECLKIDEWPGEEDAGTSVLAGAKVMQRLGLLKQYRWGFNTPGIRRGILTTGPVVLGLPWLDGMWDAPGGILRVEGSEIGGHCVLAHAYAVAGEVFDDEPAYGILNSWGPEWGDNGRAWVRESGLSELMRHYGEACIPFRRSYGR